MPTIEGRIAQLRSLMHKSWALTPPESTRAEEEIERRASPQFCAELEDLVDLKSGADSHEYIDRGAEFEQCARAYFNEPANVDKWDAYTPTGPNGNGKSRGVFKPAKRTTTKGTEQWRILRHYPEYEVSNYGRVRSMDRAQQSNVLKPRFKWYRGNLVIAYRLVQDGIAKDAFLGGLLLSVGFLKPYGSK